MRVAVKKLPIDDVAKLQALVIENFDAIEHGLTVLDSRLLLGHASVDVVGVDAAGTLVLGAVGFTADEDMLLKAVEAYSWCLEYPESLVRHYPSCQLSEDRPPRLLFVAQRVPDSFQRKIKQLGFPEVDCVEVRHLEFDGVAAVYFETLLNLRRGLASGRSMEPESTRAPGDPAPQGAAPRAVGAKIPRVGNADTPLGTARVVEPPMPARDPGPVVSMITRQSVVPVHTERQRPAPEPPAIPDAEPIVPDPIAEAVAVSGPPALGHPVAAPIVLPSLTAAGAEPVTWHKPPGRRSLRSTVAAATPPESVAPEAPRAFLGSLAPDLPGETGTTPAASAVEEPTPAAVPTLALTVEPPAQPIAATEVTAPLTVEALAAASSPVALATEPAQATTPAFPQPFAGLSFPNDGVLTRQWMEFLNQMSSSK